MFGKIIKFLIGSILLLIVSICISYNIYLNCPSKEKIYTMDKKMYEIEHLNSFYDYYKNNLTEQEYNNFIKDLDRESKNEVKFIIKSILLFEDAIKSEIYAVYPFSNRQVNDIFKYYKYNDSKIVLNDSIIQYGEYKFPENNGTVHVLYNLYGMNKVEDKARLKNKAVIDAGAYIGDSAMVLSKYTDDKIYAFEPVDDNYEKLIQTITLNNAENKIIPEKLCISDDNKPKTIYADEDELYSANSMKGQKKYVVDSITIDEFVESNNLNVGIIKSDIEGDEMKLLKGAKNTIINQKPLLLISIYHSGKDFFEIKKWLENLNLGYKFKIYRSKPDDILNETLLIAE